MKEHIVVMSSPNKSMIDIMFGVKVHHPSLELNWVRIAIMGSWDSASAVLIHAGQKTEYPD